MSGTDAVKIKVFHFPSSNNYTEIYGKAWIPEGEVKAIVQISHGMQEHIGRYDEFARFFAEKGILVIGNDHMGHGKSVYQEEDMGYFSIPIKGLKGKAALNNNSNAYVVRDLHRITKVMKKRYPGIPYILLGHSMGSFMVERYIMEYGKDVDGAIIVGTGNYTKATLKTGKALIKSLSMIYGERYRSELVNEIMFGKYNMRIDNQKTKLDWMCSDPEVIETYLSDDKCGILFTLNGFEALLSAIEYSVDVDNIKKIPKDLKILFASGSEDPVGGYGEHVKELYETYKEVGIKDVSLELYEGCRHEILNEVIKKTVYADMYDWIKEHVNKNYSF